LSFGSHADRAVCEKRGLVKPVKSPRLAANAVANALTVATPAIFIGGGAPHGRVQNSYEKRVLVARITALLAVTLGICTQLKGPRLIKKTYQSWLPLPFPLTVVT
jgi:hypothetical protein